MKRIQQAFFVCIYIYTIGITMSEIFMNKWYLYLI